MSPPCTHALTDARPEQGAQGRAAHLRPRLQVVEPRDDGRAHRRCARDSAGAQFSGAIRRNSLTARPPSPPGPLVGGAHTNKLAAKNWGNLVIAIHPGMLGDADAFYKNAGEVLDRVRTAERLPGVSEMVIPGEKESTLAAQRLKDGALPIEKNMLEELRAMAAKFTGDYPAELAAGGSAAAVGGGQEEILAKLLMKLDNLEQQVGATATAQQKLEAMLRK